MVYTLIDHKMTLKMFKTQVEPRAAGGGPSWYQSAVVLFDRGHPRFWNFSPIIPVDVVRMKYYVNRIFHPTGVPMWVSVNKLNLISERIVTRCIAVF